MSFLAALQASPVGEWVRSSDYGYYICLAGHAIGMGAVVGVIFMLGIRVLGFAKEQSILQFQPLFVVAWLGFILNAATGAALFSANGENLVKNVPFLLKISFIALGGLSQWVFWRTVTEEEPVIEAGGQATLKAKVLAVVTIGCWVFAILAGRIIGYTIDY